MRAPRALASLALAAACGCSLLSFDGVDARPGDAAADAPADAPFDAEAGPDARDADADTPDGSLPVTKGLVLWARASPADVAIDAGIERWRDRTAGKIDLVQPTPARRPQWAPAALGGRGGVRVASGAAMSFEKDLFENSVGGGVSIFLVCDLTQAGTWLSFGGVADAFVIEATPSGVVITTGSSSTPPFPVVGLGARHVYAIVLDASRALVVRDGADGGAAPGAWAPPAASRARRDFAGVQPEDGGAAASSAVGDYGELVVYDRAVTAAELDALVAHLSKTWGL